MLEKSCKRSCILQQKLCHVLQQYAAKGVGKWCFAFYHQRSSMCCNNQVVGNCVNTDFWFHKITRESHHKRELRHSLEKKFPWVGKTRSSNRFYCKKKNHSILTKHYFCGITRNTAIELVLQHLMLKNKLHVLPYLICVDHIRMNPLVSILLSKRI